MDDRNLVRWMSKQPKPATIRLDDEHSVKIGPSRKCWTDALAIVRAKNPATLEAMDSDGNLLRHLDLAEREEDDGVVRKNIDERKHMTRMAELIMEAGDRGAQRCSDAYATSFRELLTVLGIVFKRQTALENAVNRYWGERERALAKMAGEGDDGDLSTLFQGVMSEAVARQMQQAMGGGDAKPNGKTNGKKPTPPADGGDG